MQTVHVFLLATLIYGIACSSEREFTFSTVARVSPVKKMASFSQSLPTFNPLVQDGNLLFTLKTNSTGKSNYTIAVCGTQAIFPTDNFNLWTPTYCSVYYQTTVMKSNVRTFRTTLTQNSGIANQGIITQQTYNMALYYKGSEHLEVELSAKAEYCRGGFKYGDNCDQTGTPVMSGVDYKVSVAPKGSEKFWLQLPTLPDVVTEYSSLMIKINATMTKKRDLFELPEIPQSWQTEAEENKDLVVEVQQGTYPDMGNKYRNDGELSLSFAKQKYAELVVSNPGPALTTFGVIITNFGNVTHNFHMKWMTTTCTTANMGKDACQSQTALSKLNATATTSVFKNQSAVYFKYVVSETNAATPFMLGAALVSGSEKETKSTSGPGIYLRKDYLPTDKIYNVSSSGKGANLLSLSGFNKTAYGTWFMAIIPGPNQSFAWWVNSLCPGNCSSVGKCSIVNATPTCDCGDDYEGLYCEVESNNGFKTEYIVLIVIAAIILAAGVIGLAVFCYNKNKEGYETL